MLLRLSNAKSAKAEMESNAAQAQGSARMCALLGTQDGSAAIASVATAKLAKEMGAAAQTTRTVTLASGLSLMMLTTRAAGSASSVLAMVPTLAAKDGEAAKLAMKGGSAASARRGSSMARILSTAHTTRCVAPACPVLQGARHLDYRLLSCSVL